jgi:hypothetical protein
MRRNPSFSVAPPKLMSSPYGLLGEAQIGEQLLRMRSMQLVDAFDLDEQSLVDQQVDPERRVEMEAFKLDRDRLLSRNRVAHFSKLRGQNRFIDRFKQARAELSM